VIKNKNKRAVSFWGLEGREITSFYGKDISWGNNTKLSKNISANLPMHIKN